MERRKPAPLADPTVFSAEQSGSEEPRTGSDPGPAHVPVRNTFVDFKTESDVPHLLTAPGKFVGRLAGFASPTASLTNSMMMSTATPTPSSRAMMSLATPMNATPAGMRNLSPVTETITAPAPSEKASLCLAQLVPAEPTRGVPVYSAAAPVMMADAEVARYAPMPMQQMLPAASLAPAAMPPAQLAPASMAAPRMMAPPMHAPVLPSELNGMPFAPPKSPQLPKELLSRAMPPTPATQAMPPMPQQAPLRQQLEGGTLIEVKPLVEAVSPPQFAPPSYSIALAQVATPSGNSPPPLFAPSCSTPGAAKINRFFPAVAMSGTAPSGMFWPEGQAVVAGTGQQVPATPNVVWPATPY